MAVTYQKPAVNLQVLQIDWFMVKNLITLFPVSTLRDQRNNVCLAWGNQVVRIIYSCFFSSLSPLWVINQILYHTPASMINQNTINLSSNFLQSLCPVGRAQCFMCLWFIKVVAFFLANIKVKYTIDLFKRPVSSISTCNFDFWECDVWFHD